MYLLMHTIHDDCACDAAQLEECASDHDLRITTECDFQHRFRMNTALAWDKCAGSIYQYGLVIRMIKERLAAEVHDKRSMRVASENLLEADLIHNAGIIKATHPLLLTQDTS